MTDLEMIKRCAEKMGIKVFPERRNEESEIVLWFYTHDAADVYDPLHDDAQAMALVKKFRLCLDSMEIPDEGDWYVAYFQNRIVICSATSSDLNRAIVECVARMI